jgi:alkylhydroperoxidase family enzyme
MPLVPYANIDELPEEARKTFDRLAVKLNIFRMMANAETCFTALLRLGGKILARQKLDDVLRELAILEVAKIEGGEYEWIQHVPIAISAGVTQAQVDAIAAGEIDAACFKPGERVLLRFTEQAVNRVRADEQVVLEMSKFLSPREIVELILAIGFYMTMARLTETTRTDLDESPGTAVVDSVPRR